jgi:hypothetical protein
MTTILDEAVQRAAALPGQRPRPTIASSSHGATGVNSALTPERPKRPVENDEYAAFARRVLRSYARRVAAGDIEALVAVTTLAADIDTAIGQAVTGLREHGYSWADIGTGSASPARPPSSAGEAVFDDQHQPARSPGQEEGTTRAGR